MSKIGTIYTSVKDGDAEVIGYKNYKEVSIKFVNTGYEDVYPAHKLRDGSFFDRSLYKNHCIQVGSVLPTKNSGNLEILEIYDDKRVKVNFLLTGNEKIFKSSQSILNGSASEDRTSKIGEIHKTNSGDSVQIVEYVNAHNVTIKFLSTGYTTTARYQNIKNGEVREPSVRVGMIFESTSCGKFEVLEYVTYEKILIKFQDTDAEKYTDGKSIVNGTVYDIDSGLPSRGYRSEQNGYLYIHRYTDEWYKIGITNNYDMRFKTLECNILKPLSFKCYMSEDGSMVRDIETKILKSVSLVKDVNPNEVDRLVKLGKNELFFSKDLEKVLTIIEESSLTEVIVKGGKICQQN